MISLCDFNLLAYHEQAEAVWSGVFLGNRVEDGLRVQLYRLGSFYIEVFYDPVGNRIERFRSFSASGQLAAYIKLN